MTDLGAARARLHRSLASDPAPISAQAVRVAVRRELPLLDAEAVDELVRGLLADLTGLGILEPLLGDRAVSDVLVNGDGRVWVEREGRLSPGGLTLDPATVYRLIERVLAPLGLRADRLSPTVDARLPDGSRVHVVVPPLAVDGPCLTIRRFPPRSWSLSDFCDDHVGALLDWMVHNRWNLVIAGSTGAGKTTLLAALSAAIGPDERVVTIEDAAELQLQCDHVVRLEARPANAEGAGGVGVRALVRAALRMRPDRIVVGEVRDGAALDMLQAMNTGHPGSVSTCHANSPADALRRLETMALSADVALSLTAVREQLVATVDAIVQVRRAQDGVRSVASVAEPAGHDDRGWQVRPLVTRGAVVAPPGRPSRRVPPLQAPCTVDARPGW